MAALALLLGACTSDEAGPTLAQLSAGCTINSDCTAPLVCAFSRCHNACETSRDCPSNQRCMASDRPFHVCQLPEESKCSYNSQCPTGQLCGVDGECRDQCAADRDCVNGQVCTQGTCAEPAELDAGRLPHVSSDGGASADAPSTGEPCSYNSDCPAPLVCGKNGLCAVQCHGDEDCALGSTCIDSRCVAGAADAGVDVAIPPDAPSGYGSSCELSSDCPAPLRCGNGGHCVYECNADIDCAGGCCVEHACTSGAACAKDAGSDAPAEACSQGAACTPTQVCHTGTLDCSGPSAVCADTGSNAADGVPCGTNQFCSNGTCAPCTPGAICVPQVGSCHVGTTSCGTGVPVCNDTGYVAADGASCGPNMVCHAGSCAACVAGSPCTPSGNACHAGVIDCSSGLPVCADQATNLPNGTACGTNMVCNAGACVGCTAGGSCVPGNPCHKGTFDCTTGAPTCTDTQESLSDGAQCGTNSYCAAGICQECVSGIACVPATNPCHTGIQQCSGGIITCQDQNTNVTDGTSCPGTNAYCVDGSCIPVASTLSVASGDKQTAIIDQVLPAPVVVRVSDTGNSQPVAGAKVTLTGPAGAAIAPEVTTTGLDGKAVFNVRLGRAAGSYTFTATSVGVTSVTVTATAIAPSPGTIFTVVNSSQVEAQKGVPGPATAANIGRIFGTAVATDGTLYLSDVDYCAVYALDPAGTLTVVAGTPGQCGAAGDGGLATGAKLSSPRGLALDEGAKLLYIADLNNAVVRVVDLNTKLIGTYAGGASPAIGSPPYGDGNSATAATLSSPAALSLGPDGTLYISDTGHNRIRAVDPNTGIITTWLASGGPCTAQVELYGCGYVDECKVVFDAAGNAFVSAQICGTGPGGGTYGILRRNPDASLTWIAGRASSGTSSDGVPATAAAFQSTPNIAMDAAGNLLVLDNSAQRVRRIEGGTGRITTLAGTGTAGTTGDFGPAASAKVSWPRSAIFDKAGNLYFGESGTYVLRAIWGVGATAPSTAKLALVGGNAQSVYPDQLQPAAMTVKLTDSTSNTVQSFPVSWRAIEPGAGTTGASSPTNVQGNSSMIGRPGLALGTYHFEASFLDIHGAHANGSPVSFSVTAAAPPAGTIFTAVNVAHVSGNSGVPGLGVTAHISRSFSGVTSDSAGTVYIADYDYCRINKLDPTGVITHLAGITCDSSGDGGPASNAGLNSPGGLALDETNGVLYVAESSGKHVRAIQLTQSPPTITTYAGNGASGASPWGNGGPATVAAVPRPTALSLGPDGALYVADTSIDRIRRIDPSSQLINDWVASGSCAAAVNLQSCYAATGCNVVWDAAGNAYISGRWCGTAPTLTGGNPVTGVAKRTPAGVLSMFAGASTSAAGAGTSDGIAATLFSGFSYSPGPLAIDAAGNVYVGDYDNDKVRRIDAVTGKITTFAGNGTPAYVGDYVLATSAQLGNPSAMTLLPGDHLAVFHGYSSESSLRIIW